MALVGAGCCSSAAYTMLLIVLLEAIDPPSEPFIHQYVSALMKVDKAGIYGVYHVSIALGNSLAKSVSTSILQNLVAPRLRARLDGRMPDKEAEKVILTTTIAL